MRAKVHPIFMDKVIGDYSKDYSNPKGIPVNSLSDLERLALQQAYFDRVRKRQAQILDEEAKLFLINGAVADDLHHYPHEKTEHADAQHLPFPAIFFEFIDPLAYGLLKGETIDIKAILFGKTQSISAATIDAHEGTSKEIGDDMYSVLVFPENFRRYSLPIELTIAFEDMPNARTISETITLDLGNIDVTYSIVQETVQDLIDLCVNLVSYINAHNVAIIKEPGKTREQIERMNKGRKRRDKLPLKPVRPYHWIEIKQSTVTIGDAQLGHEGSTLDHREWVRGHFQVYHTNNGRIRPWVEPYVRGPPDAPWKENRYKVLDAMQKRGPKY